MKYLLRLLLIITIFLALSVSHKTLAAGGSLDSNFAVANCATSQSCGDAQQGANEVNNGSSLNINQIIATIVNILSWIIGIVAIIMVIFGGFRFITSGGDSNAVSSARNTIFYALIGLAIAALAQAIVYYLVKKFF